MYKRRVAALAAAAGLLLMSGLTGSAMADDTPKDGPSGTCTTSDGKTFEFKDAVPAIKADDKHASPTESVVIKRAEPGVKGDLQEIKDAESVKPTEALPPTSGATESVEAAPGTPPALPDGTVAQLKMKADGNPAITVVCKLN